MEGASVSTNPRTVEEVFKDFKGRRAGMLKALTSGNVGLHVVFVVCCLFAVYYICLFWSLHACWNRFLPGLTTVLRGLLVTPNEVFCFFCAFPGCNIIQQELKTAIDMPSLGRLRLPWPRHFCIITCPPFWFCFFLWMQTWKIFIGSVIQVDWFSTHVLLTVLVSLCFFRVVWQAFKSNSLSFFALVRWVLSRAERTPEFVKECRGSRFFLV